MDLERLLAEALIAISAIAGATKIWLEKRKQKKLNQVPRVIARVNRIHHELSLLRHRLKAQRAVILRAENGGQIPQVGHDLHSSVVYEDYGDNYEPVFEAWKEQRMDQNYVRLLARVITQGQVRVVTEDLEDGSILKDEYLAHNTVQSIVSTIATKQNEFYYLSVTFSDDREIDHDTRDRIRVSISRLKKLIQDV